MRRSRLRKSPSKILKRLKHVPVYKISGETIHSQLGKDTTRFVVMTPAEYFKHVPETRIYDPSFYMTKIAMGKVMYPPYIEVDVETGETVGHEGRHRAYASWKLGVKHIPVILEYSKKTKGKVFGVETTYHSTRDVDVYKHLPALMVDPKSVPVESYKVYFPKVGRVKKK